MKSQTMNTLNLQLLDKIMFGTKEGDWLVLDDDTLRAAVDNTRPLTRNEWNSLINSPLTLKRLRHIIGQAKAKTLKSVNASNDDLWLGSEGFLRAAAGRGGEIPTLHSEDGMWTLMFLQGPSAIRMLLKLDRDTPLARQIMDSKTEVAVKDGTGQVLMQGHVDEEGELEADWPFSNAAPYAHFQASGGRFQVQPC